MGSFWRLVRAAAAAGAVLVDDRAWTRAMMGMPCAPLVEKDGAVQEFSFAAIKDSRKEVLLMPDDTDNGALLYFAVCQPLAAVSPVGESCGKGVSVASINIEGCKGWGALEAASGWKGTEYGISNTFSFVKDSAGAGCDKGRHATIELRCILSEQAASAEILAAVDAESCSVSIVYPTEAGCSVGTRPPVPASPATSPSSIPGSSGEPTPRPNGDGGRGGSSGFAVFLTILLIGILLYCGVGVALNIRNEGRRGLDAIPHREFWLALPSLAIQVAYVLYDKVSELCGAASAHGPASFQSFGSTLNSPSTHQAAGSMAGGGQRAPGPPGPPGSYSVI